jgi:hypothetical protein
MFLDPYERGVADALEKFAMSRGRAMARQFGQMFQSTKDPRYLNLAARAGEAAFSPTSRPVQRANIGGGAEANVNLMVGPHAGQAKAQVWKQGRTDSSAFSQTQWNRRAQLGAENAGNPAFAQFLGESQGPKGAPIHKYEYVQGTPMNRAQVQQDPQLAQAYMRTRMQAGRAGRQAGMRILDAKPGNMVRPANGGDPKLVDYLAFKPDELYSNAMRKRMGVQETRPLMTPKGEQMFPNLGPSNMGAHETMQQQQQQLLSAVHRPPQKRVPPPGDPTRVEGLRR